MKNKSEDKKADIKEVLDRGETVILMEPLLLGEGSGHGAELTDLVVELVGKGAGFRRSLPGGIVAALADLVRAMNCYYSNLIEGHDTQPIDIERALKNDYNTDPHKRDLQLEAKAHIAVQRWIDDGNLRAKAATADGLREIHRRFCEMLPEDLLWVEEPRTHERVRVVAGELRQRDVQVGRHISISPGAIPRFLSRFEDVYGRLGRTDAILAAASAHHRLLWIHPFLDGNGRVTRLVSHSMHSILAASGLWREALPATSSLTKHILPNAISSAATIFTVGAISAKRPLPRSPNSSLKPVSIR